MKRSRPLRRRTPLRSRGGLSRSGPIKPKPPRSGGVTEDTARSVLQRDGFACQARAWGFATGSRCEGRLHVHHRRLRSQGGSHEPENLLTLCDFHHRLAHDVLRAEAEEAGVIIRSPLRGGSG